MPKISYDPQLAVKNLE